MAFTAREFWRSGLVLSGLALGVGCSAEGGDDGRNRGAATAQAGGPSQGSDRPNAGGGSGGIANASGAGPTSAGAGGSSTSTGSATAGRDASSAAAGRAAGASGSGSSATAGAAGKPPSSSAGAAALPPLTGDLFKDDFEDGDFTKPSWIDADPEAQAKWAIATAESGKVLAQTSADADDWAIAVAGDYRWTDQTVEAKVKITSEPGKAGIFARVKDVENYYFLYLDGGSNIVLRKRVDNSSNDVMKVKVETLQDKWYTLRLSVKGDKIEGALDGMVLVTGTDASVKTGGLGVGTSDCTAQFDDVTVKN